MDPKSFLKGLHLFKKKPDKNIERNVEELIREAEEDLRNSFCDEATRRGGVTIEHSNCCGVPITYSQGGIVIPICSKCGKEYRPIIIKSKSY